MSAAAERVNLEKLAVTLSERRNVARVVWLWPFISGLRGGSVGGGHVGLHVATEGTVRKLWYPEGAGLHTRLNGLVAFV